MHTGTVVPRELPRDDYLDALRGLAILGVIAVHVGFAFSDLPSRLQRLLSHGQFGVQLFFVVSAFTLAQSSDRSGGPTRFSPQRFFIRRFFRIVPAYWLAIAVYLGIAAYIRLPDDWPSRTAASLLFLNYLQPRWLLSGLPPGGWSIVVEVFFYLLFPLLYAWVKTAGRALVALGLSAVVSLVLSHPIYVRTGVPTTFLSPVLTSLGSYFGIVNQLQIFCCGLLALRTPELLSRHRLCSLVAIALILVSCLFKLVPDSLELLYFGGLFALLLKSLQRRPLPIFVNRLLVVTGEVSFSIYLVHFAVLSLLENRWPLPLAGIGGLCVFAPVVFLFSFGLAALSYRYVEKPFIAMGRRFTRSARGYDGVHQPAILP